MRTLLLRSCARVGVGALRDIHGGPLPVEFIAHGPPSTWPSVLFDSPHSGRWYPSHQEWPVSASVLTLRRGEDAYMDELLKGPARIAGIPLLAQTYPRCYVDVNRDASDIDESLLDEPWPLGSSPTAKSKKGLGLIRRLVRPGEPIYDQETKLSTHMVWDRLQRVYWPYHGALRATLDALLWHHGKVWHINWHSCKSRGNAMTPDGETERPDFIVSNADGRTAGPELTDLVVGFLRDREYTVGVNTPYKGGYIVKHYGHVRGANGDGHVHSLQVEVNRALYLDQEEVKIKPDLCEALREDLEDLCHLLAKKAPKGKPKRHAKDKSEPQ